MYTTRCGTPGYVAPEMIIGNPYDRKIDIWSSGIILFVFCSGRLPFTDDDTAIMMEKFVQQEIIYPTYFSKELTDLLKKMLEKDPEKRIDIPQIKVHPWVENSMFDKISGICLAPSESQLK